MEVDKEYSSYQHSRNVPQHRNTENNWRSDELTLLFTNGDVGLSVLLGMENTEHDLRLGNLQPASGVAVLIGMLVCWSSTTLVQSEISNYIDRHEQAFMVPSGLILMTLMILTEVDNCGFQWNVSAVIGWSTMKYGTHFKVHLRMYCNHFGDPLTFLVAQPSGSNLILSNTVVYDQIHPHQPQLFFVFMLNSCNVTGWEEQENLLLFQHSCFHSIIDTSTA